MRSNHCFYLALLAPVVGLLGACTAEKRCYVYEVWDDGGADAAWWQRDGGSDGGCPAGNACGGCSVLAIQPGEACGTCGGEYECTGPDELRCADPCMLQIGCADGQREGFLDATAFPDIAACSGGWTEPGILGKSAVCGRRSGDDSQNPDGISCATEDLCAEGWHVCASTAEVAASSPTGCAGGGFPAGTFYAAAVSGEGDGECTADGTNDLFGCGTAGSGVDASCAPLDRTSEDECEDLSGEWDCPGSWLFGSDSEAEDVRKNGPAGGGVLCCRVQP
jgi:hypothetical protein